MKRIRLMAFYNSIILQVLFFGVVNLFLIPPVIILTLIKPFTNVRFVRLRDNRFGHLIMNTELFLRRIDLGSIDINNTKYIGIASNKPCNKWLLHLFKRKMKIIQIPNFIYQNLLFRAISSKKSLLGFLGIYTDLPFEGNEYYELNSKTTVKFSRWEREGGKELLKKLGVNDSWYICFQARDHFGTKEYNSNPYAHDFRNCSIDSYLPAAEYISKKNGYAIRMGSEVKEKLPPIKNTKIIDYATTHRTEFGDVFLPGNCKFFLGNTSGLACASLLVNIPVVRANIAPFLCSIPTGKKDLFIPKKVWSKEKKRLLTFKEMAHELETNHGKASSEYKRKDLKLIENTPKEILDLTVEMNERLDGTWKATREDEKLQKKFKSIFNEADICYGFPSRIGAKFLRENKHLLN